LLIAECNAGQCYNIFMAEKTLVIYKPDAVRRNIIGEITTLFQDRGLKWLVQNWAGIQENSGRVLR